MYKIGIVINENEVSHSKYADTLGTVNAAIDECNQNGSKGNSYHFIIFDKFNVHTLFDSGENNILTFDGIFIATNALSQNEKIFNLFCSNKQNIEDFINSNKGIFISSQKKLSNGSLSNDKFVSIGFLPETYDYYVFDRPEKYSADGEIKISTSHIVLEYPYKVNYEIIKNHCENNQFIVHKYRSLIIPKHSNSYDTLLHDNDSTPISHNVLGYLNGDRKVLLSGRYNKRIVISTMALDWANHAELLCNILTFITGSKPLTIFVKKENERIKSTIIDSYIIRANIANLPYRVILENELDKCVKTSGNAFIFSPKWLPDEIERIYEAMLHNHFDYFSIYHICKANVSSNKSHKLSKYCNFSSIDAMKDAVIQNLLSSYLSSYWNKSVWTYSYVLNLVEFYDVDIPLITKKIYQELSNHFTKKEASTGKTELTGCYDNVFNATCKMLEILNYFRDKYSSVNYDDSRYTIDDVIKSADHWLLAKIEAESVFDQDICYCLLYLVKKDRYYPLYLNTKSKLTKLLTQLLASIGEEIISARIKSRSSVDLCRLYQTLCMISVYRILTEEETAKYLNNIEAILKERQDIHGNWKNISETAEITAMLLECYETRSKIDVSTNTVHVLITKGIEILHSQYNPRSNMWSDDIGTTAKAMYAIGMYDKIFNFAINDFFFDLNNNQEARTEIDKEMNIDRIGNLYHAIDALEKEKEFLNKKIMANEKAALVEQIKLTKTKNLSLSLLGILISTLFVVVIIIGALFVSHKNILSEILGDWKSYIFGGFVGLFMTIIWGVTHDAFSKRIKE